MPTQSRVAPHLILGIFTVLNVLAIFVSANSAPQGAQEQLRLAAADTAAASSFVTTYTYSVTQATSGTRRLVVHFIFQAPDRVEEIGVNGSGKQELLLSIGGYRYLKQGATGWQEFAPAAGAASYGLLAAQSLARPLKAVASATSVVKHSGTYSLTPADEASFVLAVLGYQPAQLTPGSLTVEAQVTGEFLTSIETRASMGTEQLDAVLGFSSIDHGPALVAPVGATPAATSP